MADITETGVVIGVFEDRKQVIQAIDALLKAGFNDEQLGFAARSTEATQIEGEEEAGPGPVRRGIVGGILGAADMLLVPFTGPADATTMLSSVLPATEEAMERLPGTHRHSGPLQSPSEGTHSTPAQRTQPDAGEEQRTSILTGGMIGGVVGAAIALLVPGIGIAIAGGALAAVLGGGVLGGVAGGFLGAFTDLGVPKEQAHYYAGEVKAGRTVVTVKTADHQQETMDLLRKYGAHDVQAH